MSHTKEPWRIGRFTGPASYDEVRETVGNMDVVVDTDTGPYVLAGCNINFPDDARANARRIVACVNACAGYSTDDLEHFGRFLSSGEADALAEHHALIEQQRDELLAALEYAVEAGLVPISSASEGGAVMFSAQVRAADKIRAAIAKATDYRNPGNTACITTGE
jgi:nitroreductase